MSIDVSQFINYVIKPSLKQIDLYAPNSEQIVLGTFCQESHLCTYLKQVGGGPALSGAQIEPATYSSMMNDFLAYKPDLEAKILRVCGFSKMPPAEELITNLKFSVIMCRVRYLWVAHALPDFGDIMGQGKYWAKYYNGNPVTGIPQNYVDNFNNLAGAYYEKQ
jgi:hypothetical protein